MADAFPTGYDTIDISTLLMLPQLNFGTLSKKLCSHILLATYLVVNRRNFWKKEPMVCGLLK
jgi:hypothetical protein